jgi:hypothetical protein
MLSHAGEASQYYTEISLTPVTMSSFPAKKNKCFWGCGENEPKYYVIGNVDKCHAYTFPGNFNKCHCYWECQQESIIHCYRECKWVSLLWKSYGSTSNKKKNLKRALHNDPAILLLAWIQRIACQHTGAMAATHIHHSTIHYWQTVGSAMVHTTNEWIKKMCYDVYISGVFFMWNEWVSYVIYG